MISALTIAATAFAAFCVWLTVRIVNRRERWAKWTLAIAVALPVLYMASFGPACWWCDRHVRRLNVNVNDLRTFYAPVRCLADVSPEIVRDAILWWGSVGNEDLSLAAAITLW